MSNIFSACDGFGWGAGVGIDVGGVAGRRGRRVSRLLLASALALAVLLVGKWGPLAAPAGAEPPLTDLTGVLTDPDGVLGNQGASVAQTLDAINAESDYRLYIAFVETFDDFSPSDWATQTALNVGLGRNDVLLAVATIDREMGLSYDNNVDLSLQQLERFYDAANGYFIYAFTGAASWGTATAQSAEFFHSMVAPVGVGGDWAEPLLILAVMAVAGAVLLFLITRRRHSIDDATITTTEKHDYGSMSTEDLQRQATAKLVGIDDALKTDEQELNFAVAEFGVEETATFSAALDRAKADVRQAFAINQRLIDDETLMDRQRREMLTQIIHICDDAAAALDSQGAAFDELRQMSERAPELLDQTDGRIVLIEQRVPEAQAELVRLHGLHSEDALASVAKNADQATALTDDAKKAIASGREALGKNDRSHAVVAARAAQNAVGQAELLLDAVSAAGANLEEAARKLPLAVDSLTADLDEAQRLAKVVRAARGGSIQPQIDEAQAALTAAAATAAEGGDAIMALTRLQLAEADLDVALAPARAKDEADKRARALLPGAIDRANMRMRSINDFITTRRQMIGPGARTRLAEASRLLNQGKAMAKDAPQQALQAVNQAEQMAEQAAAMAQSDFDQNSMMFGGPGGANLTGMILGGIVMGQVLGGGMRVRGPMVRGGMRGMGGGFGGYGPSIGTMGGVRGASGLGGRASGMGGRTSAPSRGGLGGGRSTGLGGSLGGGRSTGFGGTFGGGRASGFGGSMGGSTGRSGGGFGGGMGGGGGMRGGMGGGGMRGGMGGR